MDTTSDQFTVLPEISSHWTLKKWAAYYRVSFWTSHVFNEALDWSGEVILQLVDIPKIKQNKQNETHPIQG